MRDLSVKYGPWAVITGASSGIGKAISKQLAQQRFKLILVARNQAKLVDLQLELEKQYAIEVKVLIQDLTQSDACQQLAAKTADLDVGLLVASAGAETNGPFIDNDEQQEVALLDLNVVSTMCLSQLFAKRFVARGKGGILMLSSLFAYQGVPYVANYAASKAYVLALGEGLNVELKPLGVDVTVVSPGLTDTPMTQNAAIDFNKMPVTSHTAAEVASIGLDALGHQATVVPGLINKMYAWKNRLVPRSWPVRLFGYLVKRARGD